MIYNAKELFLMDFDDSPFEGQKWVCWPTRINGLGLAQMGLLSVPREPNDIKDCVCVTTRAAGYGCALCISRCAVDRVHVINDAPWRCAVHNMHGYS